MAAELIINVTFKETRAAYMENGTLVEFFVERESEASVLGNIYKGRVVRVVPGMDAAFVDIGHERAAFLQATDLVIDRSIFNDEILGSVIEGKERIEGVLEEGQEVMVQVSRESLGNKGVRVTSKISIPGRLLVLCPFSRHIGVSRRIEAEKERSRLLDILKEISSKSFGLIARTACEGKSKEEIVQDLNFLTKIWQGIHEKYRSKSAPCILYQDFGLVYRVIRDLHGQNLRRIVVDDEGLFHKIDAFLREYLPEEPISVELFQGEEPIFEAMGVEPEVSKIPERKIYLKSGGYIVIDYGEALTAIDVNTGRYLGKKDLEDTILRTNLEAAREIAYQIRLKNLGGIIIVDFIDMERKESKELVYQTLCDALRKDRIKTYVYPISELGLVQITRKRTRNDVVRSMTEQCSHCDGSGLVSSRYVECYRILRALRYRCMKERAKEIDLYISKDVAQILFEEERSALELLEKSYGKRINVVVRPELAMGEYRMEVKA